MSDQPSGQLQRELGREEAEGLSGPVWGSPAPRAAGWHDALPRVCRDLQSPGIASPSSAGREDSQLCSLGGCWPPQLWCKPVVLPWGEGDDARDCTGVHPAVGMSWH